MDSRYAPYPSHAQGYRLGGMAAEGYSPLTVLDLSMKRPDTPIGAALCMVDTTLSIRVKEENPSSTVFDLSSPRSSEASENSTNPDSLQDSTLSPPRPKITRPFKAYPKDPLNFATLGVIPNEVMIGNKSADDYIEFRKKMMAQVQQNQKGTNKNMRRVSATSQNANVDPDYLEKRRKNNEAAKRSRDARRAKEDEIAVRCAYLEKENIELRCRAANLERQLSRFI